MNMRNQLCMAAALLLSFSSTWAGTVTFSDQIGNHFAFRNMTEFGANVPPSSLDLPTLITNPYDTIKFRPSTFLVVESNGPVRESSSLSSELSFTLNSLAGLAIQEIKISVTGTYATTLFSNPAADASVGLSLALDLTHGTTVWNRVVPIVKDPTNLSWSGILTLSQADLNSYFSPPSMEIQQLSIRATPTVTADALYANARSQINYLDFTVVAIPEPGSWQLVLAALSMGLLVRKRKTKSVRPW